LKYKDFDSESALTHLKGNPAHKHDNVHQLGADDGKNDKGDA
jgi:hypothetical protein